MSCIAHFRRLTAALFCAAALACAANSWAAVHQVSIGSTKFSPDHVTIAVGDTVVWASTYGVRYNGAVIGAPSVTFDGGSTNAPAGCSAIPKGETCSAEFSSAGTFTYRNTQTGVFNVSGTVTVIEDEAAIVAVSAPTNNVSILLGEALPVAGEASDPDGTIDQVELFVINGSWTNSVGVSAFAAGATGATNVFNLTASGTNFVAGTNTLRAVASAVRGAGASVDVEVVVETNAAPVVALESLRLLASGSGQSVVATALATDGEAESGGGIARVEFLLNGASQLIVTNDNAARTNFSVTIATNLLDLNAANTLEVNVTDTADLTASAATVFQFADLNFLIAPGSVIKSGNTISFDLSVLDGVQYRLETSTNLVEWITSFTFTASGTNRPFVDFADRDVMRFYRIVRDL
jgi:plastocyanin